MNFKEEYSEKFDELRKNRVKTSFYKYGSAKENFGKGYVDALGSLENALQNTGKQEIQSIFWMRGIMPCLNICIPNMKKPTSGRRIVARAQVSLV